MKEIVSLLIVAVCFSKVMLAQTGEETSTNLTQDYIKQIHNNLSEHSPPLSSYPQKVTQQEITTFSPDTNWVYEELKNESDQTYYPSLYSLTFDSGAPNAFVRVEEQNFYNVSTEKWYQGSDQKSYYNSNFLDSTVYHSFDQEGELRSAEKFTYLRNPQPGFTSEYYKERYTKSSGWQKTDRKMSYYNEDSTIYWARNFRFDDTLDDFYLFQIIHNEQGANFDLVESRRYNPDEIETWYKRYTRYDNSGRIIYQTESRLNATKTASTPTDSTHYHYTDTETTAETYKISTLSGWKLKQFTRTFSSPKFGTAESSTDSILTYSIRVQDDIFQPDTVVAKTLFFYDANGNKLEEHYYNFELYPTNPLNDKLVYKYQLIDGEYLETEEKYVRRYFITGTFYTSWVNSTSFTEKGEKYDHSALTLSASGDTVSLKKTQFIHSKDITHSIEYIWDKELKRFSKASLFSYGEEFPVSTLSVVDERGGYSYRSMEVSSGYPAVFNNGPIQIALGDTLSFPIKAFNPDLSKPKLNIENLPASATFDEETYQFFWIVDELNPAAMTYTVSDDALSYSTIVTFVSGELAVSNEVEAGLPSGIQLRQNYPNPFNPTTTIEFKLSSASSVSLKIFNVMGQQVAELIDEQNLEAGIHTSIFYAPNLASGLYYYQLTTSSFSAIKSMILLK